MSRNSLDDRLSRLERAVLALIELCELPKLEELHLTGATLDAAMELDLFRRMATSGTPPKKANGKENAA